MSGFHFSVERQMSLKSLSSEHLVSLKGQTLKCIRRVDAAQTVERKKNDFIILIHLLQINSVPIIMAIKALLQHCPDLVEVEPGNIKQHGGKKATMAKLIFLRNKCYLEKLFVIMSNYSSDTPHIICQFILILLPLPSLFLLFFPLPFT